MAKGKKLSLDSVYQAAFKLKEVARMTDLIYSPHFSGKIRYISKRKTCR